jgi:hypothetical protein
MWKAFGAIAAYHLIVGCFVVQVIQTERNLSALEKIEWAVGWPIVVGANVYMQDKWVALIDDIKPVLEELNSGRWERKP